MQATIIETSRRRSKDGLSVNWNSGKRRATGAGSRVDLLLLGALEGSTATGFATRGLAEALCPPDGAPSGPNAASLQVVVVVFVVVVVV